MKSASPPAIQCVRRIGRWPMSAIATPVIAIVAAAGFVNQRSLFRIPSIAWCRRRGSPVRWAWRCQKSPVTMLPRNITTAPTCRSFKTRYMVGLRVRAPSVASAARESHERPLECAFRPTSGKKSGAGCRPADDVG